VCVYIWEGYINLKAISVCEVFNVIKLESTKGGNWSRPEPWSISI
jgi:hypothetical protein